MSWEGIAAFAALVLLGSYIQTQVGFAIAMIVGGGATILGLAPVAFTANVVAFIALANPWAALFGRMHLINRGMLAWLALGVIPITIVGLWLLLELSVRSVQTLEFLLGVVIFLSGISLTIHPHPMKKESGRLTHTLFGGFAGLLMGLFSAGGPPVIIHIYRQPIDFQVARATLLAILGLMPFARIIAEGVNGNLTSDVLEVSVYAVLASFLGVALARRFPMPVSDELMKRLAFALLAILGLSLMISRW